MSKDRTLRLIAYPSEKIPYADDQNIEMVYPFIIKNAESIVNDSKRRIGSFYTLGFKSNTFQARQQDHNLFLEWDTKDRSKVDVEAIYRETDGMLIETGQGYHIIKPDSLSIDQLCALQSQYKCCPGFVGNTQRRGFATLRIGPKEGSYLCILESDGPSALGVCYRKMVSLLHYVPKPDTFDAILEEAVNECR